MNVKRLNDLDIIIAATEISFPLCHSPSLLTKARYVSMYEKSTVVYIPLSPYRIVGLTINLSLLTVYLSGNASFDLGFEVKI
jgi:hypothetical protein